MEFVFPFTSACQGERDGFLQSSSGQRLQPATRPTLPSKAKRELRNQFTVMKSDITAAHSSARDCFPALTAYLRPFGIVIELFDHIHPLFGIDRAVHCGVLQPQALQVHSHNFEHARPLRDNHAAERTGSSQPALCVLEQFGHCSVSLKGLQQFRHPSPLQTGAPSQFRNRGTCRCSARTCCGKLIPNKLHIN